MVSELNIFAITWSKIALQNMVETTLPDGMRLLVEGYIANFGISLDVFEFSRFGFFFSILNFFLVLVHPTVVLVLLSASVERFDVSRMRDIFLKQEQGTVFKQAGCTPTRATCVSASA